MSAMERARVGQYWFRPDKPNQVFQVKMISDDWSGKVYHMISTEGKPASVHQDQLKDWTKKETING